MALKTDSGHIYTRCLLHSCSLLLLSSSVIGEGGGWRPGGCSLPWGAAYWWGRLQWWILGKHNVPEPWHQGAPGPSSPIGAEGTERNAREGQVPVPCLDLLVGKLAVSPQLGPSPQLFPSPMPWSPGALPARCHHPIPTHPWRVPT